MPWKYFFGDFFFNDPSLTFTYIKYIYEGNYRFRALLASLTKYIFVRFNELILASCVTSSKDQIILNSLNFGFFFNLWSNGFLFKANFLFIIVVFFFLTSNQKKILYLIFLLFFFSSKLLGAFEWNHCYNNVRLWHWILLYSIGQHAWMPDRDMEMTNRLLSQ